MAITLADRERRLIAAFEDETGASVTDCVVFEGEDEDEDAGEAGGPRNDRAVFVVAAGDMGTAIGPGGRAVKAAEACLGWDIDLVEAADTPEAFVANALAPAAVYDVEIREEDGAGTVAYAEVPEPDRGAAIGRGGRNIQTARRLADRHYGIDAIELA